MAGDELSDQPCANEDCDRMVEAVRLPRRTCRTCAGSDQIEADRWTARGSVDDIRWRRERLPAPLRQPSQRYDED